MIEVDRLTVKAAEALRAAFADAGRCRSAEVYGIHLLEALLRQEEGIVTPILDKIGVSASAVGERVQAALDGLGRVSGGSDARVSRDLARALSAAERHAGELGDDYVSTEHLLLGLTVEKDDAGEILCGRRGPRRSGCWRRCRRSAAATASPTRPRRTGIRPSPATVAT